MQKLRPHHWYSRIIAIAVTLLISNVAALTCAMAAALCSDSDCSEHDPAPIVCVESCASEFAAANDKPADNFSGFKPVGLSSYTLPTLEIDGHFATAKMANNNSIAHDPPPPLNLLYCVFLK
jgi:hypothetical protein